MVQHASRQQIFIVTLAGVEAAERPKVTEMQSGKNAAVTEIAICQYLEELHHAPPLIG